MPQISVAELELRLLARPTAIRNLSGGGWRTQDVRISYLLQRRFSDLLVNLPRMHQSSCVFEVTVKCGILNCVFRWWFVASTLKGVYWKITVDYPDCAVLTSYEYSMEN